MRERERKEERESEGGSERGIEGSEGGSEVGSEVGREGRSEEERFIWQKMTKFNVHIRHAIMKLQLQYS